MMGNISTHLGPSSIQVDGNLLGPLVEVKPVGQRKGKLVMNTPKEELAGGCTRQLQSKGPMDDA